MKKLIPVILLITACGGSDNTTYTSDSRLDDEFEEYCEFGLECDANMVPSHTEVVDCVQSEFSEYLESDQTSPNQIDDCLYEFYELMKCINEYTTCEGGIYDPAEPSGEECGLIDDEFDCCYYDMDC